MEVNNYDTLVEATAGLKERGFTDDYKMEDGKLKNTETNKMYQSEDLEIVEFHRFEGMTNPGDSSAIYAVECSDDTKGTIVATYGVYANEELDKFLKAVKVAEGVRTI